MPALSDANVHLIHGVIRKLAHVTEYFVLGLLLFRAFKNNSTDMKLWRWASYSMMVIILFALGDEFHQSFVVTRTSSLIDVGIDMVGGFFGQCVILLWIRRHRFNM